MQNEVYVDKHTLYIDQGCVKPSMKIFKYKPKPFVSVINSF